MALTYDQITAITNAYYLKKFPQLVFDRNIIFSRLWRKGSKVSSGKFLQQPLKHAMTKGGAYSPYDVFDVSAENQITAAQYDWKYYEVPITISRDEILKNDGPEGVKSLMDAKMSLAAMKLADDLATDLWLDTTQDSSPQIGSIQLMCDDASPTLTSFTTYGGISRADLATWVGTINDYGGGGIAQENDYANEFAKTWFLIADGDIHTTLIIAHNDFLDRYWRSARPDQRYIDKDLLKQGWTAMQFNAVPVVGDLHLPAYGAAADNRIFFLNEEFIDLVSHSEENMRFEPFAKPIDQAVSVAHMFWAGNITCSDCSRQGVFYNFTTSF